MASLKQNVYIIKQSEGTIWHFSYDKKFGIIYEICKNDIWSNYNILTKATTNNFSVDLLSNDDICIVYEDLDGNIILNLYDNIKWKSSYLIKNDKNSKIKIYFKTTFFKNSLLLFYSIYNSITNTLTIVSQIIDENGDLNSPKLIDKINYEYDIPFYLYTSKENKLYIMYQKKESNHLLGYKVLSNHYMPWSKFNIIDKSPSPFKEYSLLSIKDKMHSLYIKISSDKTHSLTYCRGNSYSYIYTNISKDTNISSSAFFIIGEHIWCMWIIDDKIYSSVSIDSGNIFSNPPQFEEVSSSSISKGIYISNFLENKKDNCIGEVFIKNYDFPQLLIIDNIYGLVHRSYKNSSYLFYLQHFISTVNKNYNYSIYNTENDDLIDKLNNIIKEQETKILSYENKLKAINSSLISFNENKEQLNKSIKLLQDNLVAKEEILKELEATYTEKEKELEILKEELNNIKLQEIDSFDLKKVFDKFSSIFKN
ncbi:hypothetical protein [Clostridium sp.]|uniref:hypothetical protein n=1 Tax=Clostridium sp. TaxID=1506 RepID=UPI00260BAF46|nr:hypothetical protein [Clostridium sp.]